MKRTKPFLWIALGLLCITGTIASAATVTQSLTYQGKLTDAAGSPLTGTYSVTFRLYDAATGGTTISTDTHSVTSANGLFTTQVAVSNPALADGRALWLGVKVGTDPEMTPRQEIRPVPYALSLRPGAVIKGSGAVEALQITKTDGGSAGLNVSTAADFVNAINVETRKTDSIGVRVNTHGEDSPAFTAFTRGYYSTGFRADTYGPESAGIEISTNGRGSKGVDIYTSFADSTGLEVDTYNKSSHGIVSKANGQDSDAIIGESATQAGVRGRGVWGGIFQTNGPGSGGFIPNGIWVNADYDYNRGMIVTTNGVESPGITSATIGEGSHGLRVSTDGMDAYGAWIDTEGRYAPAVRASTNGDSSQGTWIETTGRSSPGILVVARGPESEGISAFSAQDVGVYCKGKEGGYFTTNGAGTVADHAAGVNATTLYDLNPGLETSTKGWRSYGVNAFTYGPGSHGLNVSTTGTGASGLNVVTTGDTSYGALLTTEGHQAYGVYTYTEGDDASGVYTRTYGDGSDGVAASTDGTTSHALFGRAKGPQSNGVVAYSDQWTAIYAETMRADDKYALFTPDYIYAKGSQYPAVDVAEFMRVTGDVPPGTVLVIADDGRLMQSTEAYDTRVAGIVSTDPAVSLGARDTGNPGEAPVAVAGRVPCKVDAGYGAIRPGDLLSTSDTPGHAMKAVPDIVNGRKYYPDGTVLGKAMGTLESGTGTIEVLVTLQ